MRHRVTRIPVHQFAKVSAVVLAASSLIFIVPMGLIMLAAPAAPGQRFSVLALPLLPLFYLFFGYVWAALSAWIYNQVANAMGGIEVELMEVG